MNIKWLIYRGSNDVRVYTVKMGLKGNILLEGRDKLIKKAKSNNHHYIILNWIIYTTR
jgi:hypothetical protein